MKNLFPATTAKPSGASSGEAACLVLDNIPETILLVDRSLHVVVCNGTAKTKIRQKLGINVVPGMPALQLVDSARRSTMRSLAAEVLNGETKSTQTVRPSADGTPEVYENFFSPARNKAGLIVGILVRCVNITERKNAEKAVQEAEERWQFALDASNQAAWDWNMQTNEVIYSSSYKKMYGFGDELKNDLSEWQYRIHPDDKFRIDQAIQEHTQSDNPLHEITYRIQLKNGEYKWIMARGKILSKDAEGRPLRMIGTHTDLTQTLQTKEELKTMNERFHYAPKASSQALWEWNALTGEAYVSAGFTEMFGWQADESGRFEQWHQYVHPDDRQATVDDYYKTLADAGECIWQATYRFLKADGSYAIVCDKACIIRAESGEVQKVIGATQDVTERKRLEEDLLRNELEMKKRINQATVDSQEQERSEIGRDLHDNVNQVLTTTKLYLELALTNKEMADELLKKSAENISSVITEIRQLSRSLMDPSIGDLGIVDSINDLAENINLTRRVFIDLQMDESIEESLGRKQKLTIFRIIQEALNNVVRHAKATRVTITIRQGATDVLLEVRDNGTGFCVDTVRKGAGLKNIINRVYLINGNFTVESQPGTGCTVRINFPVKEPTNT